MILHGRQEDWKIRRMNGLFCFIDTSDWSDWWYLKDYGFSDDLRLYRGYAELAPKTLTWRCTIMSYGQPGDEQRLFHMEGLGNPVIAWQVCDDFIKGLAA